MVDALTARKPKSKLRRWELWVGILCATLSVAVAVVVILYWQKVRFLEAYGYLGAFLISVFGGATILAPIPMTPIIFALGAILKPSFAPILGPIFVGAAAGIGETVGGLTIYLTGYSGSAHLAETKHGRLQTTYLKLVGWMERRGSLVLFVLSAVLNPFFYPAALAAGALRFGMRKYFLICWAGKTIKGITVAAAGYYGLGGLLRLLGIPV